MCSSSNLKARISRILFPVLHSRLVSYMGGKTRPDEKEICCCASDYLFGLAVEEEFLSISLENKLFINGGDLLFVSILFENLLLAVILNLEGMYISLYITFLKAF